MPSRPATERAVTFLRSRIRARAPGERLETLPALAAAAGVALVTMARAVHVLRDQGRLAVAQRAGIRILRTKSEPDRHATDAAEVPPRKRRSALTARIRHDLFNGRFPPGSLLPPSKELAQTYGVCLRTLRTAIHSLVADDRLRYERRRVRAPGETRSRAGYSLVLLTPGESQGDLRLLTSRAYEYVRHLEAECSRRRLRLVTIMYNPSDGIPYDARWFSSLKSSHYGAGSLGYLLIGCDVYPSAIIESLASTRRAVAILDENGAIEVGPGWRGRPRVCLFGVGHSPRCARLVGRHLLEQGHRKVAFVNPMHRDRWSRTRLEGLVAEFREAGFAEAVTACVADAPADVARAGVLAADLAQRLKVVKSIRALRGQTSLVLQRELIRPAVMQLAAEALRCGATAWVGANDNVALECMDWLERRRIPVAQKISIIGFDNSLPAFHHGLSSYSFNESAIIHAMVEHALSATSGPAARGHTRPVEIDGYVVSRQSSAALDTAAPGRTAVAKRESRS